MGRLSEQKTPTFSVIVPVFNSMPSLKQCICSIVSAMHAFGEATELIVIDHGSTDGSYEYLSQAFAGDAFITQIKEGTIASLRNRGAQMSKGEYLVFIDSDCVISPSYFKEASKVLRSIDADATGSKCTLPSPAHWVEETWHKLHARQKDGYVNYLNSGNFVIRRAVFATVGGFNSSLITDEDAELGQRLRAAGGRIYESHAVSAIHLRNPKGIGQFFRKEVWRGLGMFRLRKRSSLDKVLTMTVAHSLLTLVGTTLALLAAPHWWLSLGVLLCGMLFAPSATLAYRYTKLGRVYRPFRSLLLYWLFFNAKACAMLAALTTKKAEG